MVPNRVKHHFEPFPSFFKTEKKGIVLLSISFRKMSKTTLFCLLIYKSNQSLGQKCKPQGEGEGQEEGDEANIDQVLGLHCDMVPVFFPAF